MAETQRAMALSGNLTLHLRAAVPEEGATMEINVLLKSCLDALIIVDEQGMILRLNPAAVGLLNLFPSEVVGQPLVRFLSEAAQECFRHELQQLRAADTGPFASAPLPIRVLRSDGQEVVAEIFFSSFLDGDFTYLVGLLHQKDTQAPSLIGSDQASLSLMETLHRVVARLEELGRAQHSPAG